MTLSEAAIKAWELGLEFLAEAESRPAAATPHMAIHAAYYAMFHCARAVLVSRDGLTAPAKHGAVANRFGYHAHQAGDAERAELATLLRTVLRDGMRSDYGEDQRPQPSQAVMAVRSARVFIEGCARFEGFPPPPALAPPS